MKITLIQSDIAWNSPADNEERCQLLAAEAISSGSNVLVFPEMFTCGFSMPTGSLAQEASEVGQRLLQTLAATHNVYTIGSLPEISPDGTLYNTAWVVAPDGSSHYYRKIHLFSFGEEPKTYTPGSTLPTVSLYAPSGDSLRCTVLICYDLRFAPLFLNRATESDIFIVVANWPASRREHWLTLLRARAIETQAYVAGVNRVGVGGGLAYSGDSVVFGPDGTELGRLSDTEGTLHCDVASTNVASWRSTFPALRDRRHEIYAQLTVE